MRAVLRLDLDPAGNIAWHGGITDQFEIKREIGATEGKVQPFCSDQLIAGHLPIERRAMHERIAFQRIADFDIAVDRAVNAQPARRKIAELYLKGVAVAVRLGAKADLVCSDAPSRLFLVLKPECPGRVDDGVADRDLALP